METRLSGNAFQILAAATGKAWLPTVESLKGGTRRRLVPEEQRERRPDTCTSATRLTPSCIGSDHLFCGSVDRISYVSVDGTVEAARKYFLHHKTVLCFRCFIASVS